MTYSLSFDQLIVAATWTETPEPDPCITATRAERITGTRCVSYLRLRCHWKPEDDGPGGHGRLCPVHCEPRHTRSAHMHAPATHTHTPCLRKEKKSSVKTSHLSCCHLIGWLDINHRCTGPNRAERCVSVLVCRVQHIDPVSSTCCWAAALQHHAATTCFTAVTWATETKSKTNPDYHQHKRNWLSRIWMKFFFI